MHDLDLTPARPCDADNPFRVCRSDGSPVAVRLRLLGYEGCEFESDEEFTTGEALTLHLYRMGSIRARVVSLTDRVVETAFEMDCPV